MVIPHNHVWIENISLLSADAFLGFEYEVCVVNHKVTTVELMLLLLFLVSVRRLAERRKKKTRELFRKSDKQPFLQVGLPLFED